MWSLKVWWKSANNSIKLINADRWQNANMLQSIYVILHQWVQLDFTSCQLVVLWFNCYIKARLLIINVILLLNSLTTTLLFLEIFFLFQIYEVLARLWIYVVNENFWMQTVQQDPNHTQMTDYTLLSLYHHLSSK